MPSKLPMVHLVIDEDLKDKISEFHHKHRFKSQSEAMRWLLAWALKKEPKP